jgi:hypothetical protein
MGMNWVSVMGMLKESLKVCLMVVCSGASMERVKTWAKVCLRVFYLGRRTVSVRVMETVHVMERGSGIVREPQ